ncbi:hypothetical protein B0I26_11433 [Anoxybacillus vitaminiphilus]|uniref:Serine aminopeptidase S33 family n=1 Tax=Paranoxybacillus vitaminiphilus TaxID=581036 RepID=A0A327YEW4_9BACL|nr:hypothetical protein [Anoxybacillus vitaminiphilus]RAK17029.1 hypothetical protein B0I26_11433 [Anoxybacillus vitaminiphilus]
MTIKERFFQLDEQWCTIHLPERPNGFAILLIGDTNHFVNEKTSFWMQHAGRSQLIEELKQYGYTIFYSNLYGRHWGSPKAVRLAKQLIYYVLKSEILNKRIYLLAEGMGALAALRLVDAMPERIRAVAMLSPCLDLQAQVAYERENKFFYKRMIKEIASAYEVKDENVSSVLSSLSTNQKCFPVKIWQMSGVAHYPSSLHCRKYEELRKTWCCPITVIYHLPEKRYGFSHAIHKFYQENNDLS